VYLIVFSKCDDDDAQLWMLPKMWKAQM